MSHVVHARCRRCGNRIESTVFGTPPWRARATAWCHIATDTIICRGYHRHAEPDPSTILRSTQ